MFLELERLGVANGMALGREVVGTACIDDALIE